MCGCCSEVRQLVRLGLCCLLLCGRCGVQLAEEVNRLINSNAAFFVQFQPVKRLRIITGFEPCGTRVLLHGLTLAFRFELFPLTVQAFAYDLVNVCLGEALFIRGLLRCLVLGVVALGLGCRCSGALVGRGFILRILHYVQPPHYR